jgi:hypothetical protein
MMDALLNRIDTFRAVRVRHMSRYREAMADIPLRLYPYWKRSAQDEFEGIPQDAFFFARAAEGLLTFFDCVRRSERPCGLPSRAADSVWHAWLRLSPASLDAFCLKHFGRTIPHVEGVAMIGGMEDALANTLVQARRLEGMPAADLSVPRLFGLDLKLRMPGGFGYSKAGTLLAYQHMNQSGRLAGEIYHPGHFVAVELLALGLIAQRDVDEHQQRVKSRGDGAGCGSSGASCDGGDGGGCGGGCG